MWIGFIVGIAAFVVFVVILTLAICRAGGIDDRNSARDWDQWHDGSH